MLELADTCLHEALVVLGRVVIGVLPEIAVGAGFGNALFDLPASGGLELLELVLHLLVGGRREECRVVGHGP